MADNDDDNIMYEGVSKTPVPDPTLLTTAALKREIAALKELMKTRLDGMDKAMDLFNANITRVPTDTDKQISHLKSLHETKFDAIEASIGNKVESILTRFEGMDKAIELLQNIEDQWPLRVDEKINALKSVHEEKFASTQQQFKERDTRTEQSSKDSKVAVDAALQAAKEAVGEQNKSSALAIAKSEAATTKQIDQMSQFIASGNKAMDDKINDMKERLTTIEGMSRGGESVTAAHRANTNMIIGGMGLLVTLVITIVGVVLWVSSHNSTSTTPQILYLPQPATSTTVPPK